MKVFFLEIQLSKVFFFTSLATAILFEGDHRLLFPFLNTPMFGGDDTFFLNENKFMGF